MTRKKQIKVWIIDDDEINRSHHKLSFYEDRPDVLVFGFESLSDAFECNSRADYIFIDLSAVDGHTLISCFDNRSYIRSLQCFVEKNRSAFIVIMSALISHAKEDVEDLNDMCDGVRLFALDSCDIKNPNALVDFVNRYSKLL